MAELYLTADDDHVERLAHENDPVRAIVELIWNAVDAEASTVTVEVEIDDTLGGITETIVSDNGHGIDRDELDSTFGRIGGSWKRFAAKTKNDKRGLHGKRGEGRLRAFALGNRVTWTSVSVDTSGVLQRLEITGKTEHRHVFTWDSQAIENGSIGTVVAAFNESQKSLGALEASRTRSILLSHFAPVLMDDGDLRITYLGTDLDPAEEVASSADYPLPFQDEAGNAHEAALRIIEWKTVRHRAIYYGQDAEHFVYEESAVDVETQCRYSAYVTWDGLDHDALSVLGLGDMSDTPAAALWTAARGGIREHFQNRRRERRREQLEGWKKEKVYPFEGDATSETEKVERAIFDVVAGTIAAQIPTKKDSARVTLGLLRTALRQDPEQLGVIFNEVASLTQEDRESLTRLLGETTMSSIIKAANVVTGRNKFLAGIERLIFLPDEAGTIGERDHLHPMLERELWIFGEAYHLMSSERGLTELARNHLKLLGLPSNKIEPVKRWDEKSGRVDLHLAVKMEEFEVARHLVVELKAPGITLGRKELNQVDDYAEAILSRSVFATDRASWDIILVGTDFDSNVENRFIAGFHSQGLVLGPEPKPGRPRVRVFIRRWRDILDENRARLRLITDSLDHNPSLEDGLRHIQDVYADLLPASLQAAAEERVSAGR
ncbi:ATP-binding protein [Kineococcus terrestris]|uniref:ATP-binding protein n=1 Tax=Kineococcus terrestris TaxID=2044856 RepID=UPI0034DB4DE1